MEENWLSILLKGLSTGFMTYAILTFMELSGIMEGTNDMDLALGLSSGAWGVIGSSFAAIITIIGAVIVQHMKNKKENEVIKNDVRDARNIVVDNVKSVSNDIQSVNDNIKVVDSNMNKNIAIPVSLIREYSKETRNAVNYLVEEQHLKNRIKEDKKNEDTGLIIKACTESLIDDKSKLMEEKNKLRRKINELEAENDDLLAKLENANRKMQKIYVENSELQNQVSELKREINLTKRAERNDDFEL